MSRRAEELEGFTKEAMEEEIGEKSERRRRHGKRPDVA
jgi:hypothetical protein